ncbi:NAD(P)/FAD-dependent oxidoreductase [Blattabacterium cuenoti]|uniref:NAD(P)/FAD-dependent oxidoreductase n=1 Tax=Blattabacterium cuenoti TaxID=1653831 RepID=UPI00163CCB38|nr:FAD-dependent oxidoreductase [Blattabacterium cuenoti]
MKFNKKYYLNNKDKIYNCIIIGSGPAGYSASIYAARYGLDPIIFLGNLPGGQLTTTNYIDNYLGFPNGIDGNEFMDSCRKQAERFNVKILNESVTDVILCNKLGGLHEIFYGHNNKILSKGIIIATGSCPKIIGIEKEKELLGMGISFCATCDGFFHKKKDVAVIGGGDTALEEANYLSDICNKVYLIVRKDYLKGSEILQNQIMKKRNIYLLFRSTIKKIIGDNILKGIEIFNNKENKYYTKLISGLFIAIGNFPNTKIFINKIDLDNNGFILTKNKSTLTSNHGVFAAGDVQDSNYKQAITSAGSGCMAAMDLYKYLNLLKRK